MSPRRFHTIATYTLCVALAVIGVALVVQGLLEKGGVSGSRVLLGVLFLAAGLARSYLEIRRRGQS